MPVFCQVYKIKPLPLRLLVLFILAAFSCALSANLPKKLSENDSYLSEMGFPLFKTYSPKEYKAHAQNWAIDQASNGLIYFGNNEGILEFDGINWRLIKVGNETVVRSLVADPVTKRIYLGVIGDFGYIEADENGKWQYISLKEKLPKGDQEFADVWSIFLKQKSVVFYSTQKLFLFKNDSFKVIKAENAFHRAFQVNERVFIREREKGLFELIDEKLSLVKGGEAFAHDSISLVVPWPSAGVNGLVLYSKKRGMIQYDGVSFKDWNVEAVDSSKSVYVGMTLEGGRLAIGTLNAGLLILNENGELVVQLSKESGLPDNVIYALKEDHDKGLWVATDRGIVRIEIDLPLSHFDERAGLDGQILTTMHFDNALYAGTSNGLYRLNRSKRVQFEKVEAISNLTFDLFPFNDRLLVANHQGPFQIKDNKVSRLLDGEREIVFIIIKRINRENQIIIGDRLGVAILELENERWIEHRISSIKTETRGLMMESESVLWVATNSNGVLRVRLPNNWPREGKPSVERFDQSSGLPHIAGNRLSRLNDEVHFITGEGISVFDEADNRFTLAPIFSRLFTEKRLNIDIAKELPGIGYWMLSVQKNDGVRLSIPGIVRGNQEEMILYNAPLSALNGQYIESVYFAPDKALWLGSEEGLYRYIHNPDKDYSVPFSILLRKVTAGNGEVVFDGAGQIKFRNLKLDKNRLRFEFAAMSFDEPEKTLYQVRLVGEDDEWSPWNSESFKDYSNLWEGRYSLNIRAKNRNGTLIESSVFEFEILPPWYRTYLAYFLYFLLFVFVIRYITQWRFRRMTRQRAILKREIKKQTQELRVAYEKMEKLSVTDALTGLKNRYFIERYMNEDISRTKRDFSDWSTGRKKQKPDNSDHIFFIIDLDLFKSVNDTYGHAAGDKILVEIKGLLLRVFRDSDYLVRWGGEEFLAVARYTEKSVAPRLAERVRLAIEEYSFDIGNQVVLKKTCSIGFACYPFDYLGHSSLTWEKVVDLADHCLYAAKKTQRNAWVGIYDFPINTHEDFMHALVRNTADVLKYDSLEIHTSIPKTTSLIWQ